MANRQGPKKGTVNNPKGKNQYSGKPPAKSLTGKIKERLAHAIDDVAGKTVTTSTARVEGSSAIRVEVSRTNPGSRLLGVKPAKTAKAEAERVLREEQRRIAPIVRRENANLAKDMARQTQAVSTSAQIHAGQLRVLRQERNSRGLGTKILESVTGASSARDQREARLRKVIDMEVAEAQRGARLTAGYAKRAVK